jgi:hypothetical protein
MFKHLFGVFQLTLRCGSLLRRIRKIVKNKHLLRYGCPFARLSVCLSVPPPLSLSLSLSTCPQKANRLPKDGF